MFKSFFNKAEKPAPPKTLQAMENPRFKPFEIKPGVIIAPIHARKVNVKYKMDES